MDNYIRFSLEIPGRKALSLLLPDLPWLVQDYVDEPISAVTVAQDYVLIQFENGVLQKFAITKRGPFWGGSRDG